MTNYNNEIPINIKTVEDYNNYLESYYKNIDKLIKQVAIKSQQVRELEKTISMLDIQKNDITNKFKSLLNKKE